MAKDEPQLIFKTEEAKWAWLAALIDGEGCMSLYKTRHRKVQSHRWRVRRGFSYRVRIRISNVNLDLMKEILRVAGCGWLYPRKKATNKKWKPYYDISFGVNATKKILPKVFPFLIVKREQASLILGVLKYFKGKTHRVPSAPLEPVYCKIKQLNHRGL